MVIFVVQEDSIGGIFWGTVFLKENFSASLDLYGFTKLTENVGCLLLSSSDNFTSIAFSPWRALIRKAPANESLIFLHPFMLLKLVVDTSTKSPTLKSGVAGDLSHLSLAYSNESSKHLT